MHCTSCQFSYQMTLSRFPSSYSCLMPDFLSLVRARDYSNTWQFEEAITFFIPYQSHVLFFLTKSIAFLMHGVLQSSSCLSATWIHLGSRNDVCMQLDQKSTVTLTIVATIIITTAKVSL